MMRAGLTSTLPMIMGLLLSAGPQVALSQEAGAPGSAPAASSSSASDANATKPAGSPAESGSPSAGEKPGAATGTAATSQPADGAAPPSPAVAPSTATAPAETTPPPASVATDAPAGGAPSTATAPAPAPQPSTAATAAGRAPSSSTAPAASPAPPAVDPVVEAVRTRLADQTLASSFHPDDVAALTAFYADRKEGPIWFGKDGPTTKGAALAGELRKADDWGLEAKAFEIPSLASGAVADALADAEARLALAAMKYARFARGGRLNPRAISRILDQDPPVKDPKIVISELASSAAPDAYLRGLHPKHEQFERLRQALLKARGPAEPEAVVDEALKIKIPAGKTMKPGTKHENVALLRRRLKVPAEAGTSPNYFDEALAEAVKAFQFQKGIKATGNLTNATRAALNSEGEVKKPSPEQSVQRLIVNMEKWRWMPEDLGAFHVWSNVPEFQARVLKDGKEIFKEIIIAGQPEWATPVFTADMKYVIFNPSWGVPDGIKMRELLPRLKKAGGGGFFDQLFGGGGGGASVLRAYGLNAYRNGQPVNIDNVDWSKTDIRSFSFTQPPGAKNPLGTVKFRFPNKHDVYMHDTTQRELFRQSYRALSHGCIRVQNPRKLADLLLEEDKGWSPERVSQAISSSGEITLDKHIPVHVTYFTAMVDEAGRVSTFGDLYGHDSRISQALGGRPMRYEAPSESELVATSASGDEEAAPVPGKKKNKKEEARKKRERTSNDMISGSLSGLIAN